MEFFKIYDSVMGLVEVIGFTKTHIIVLQNNVRYYLKESDLKLKHDN